MDKNSQKLIVIFICMLLISIGVMWCRYIILQDMDFYTDEEAFNQALLER